MIRDSFKHKGLRKALVEELITKGITDKAVLDEIGKIPRHIFLDSSLDNLAYIDKALPIGCDQTISQPYTVAFQTQLLELKKTDKVLEIGTGSGYQTCVLSEISSRIYSIERHKPLHIRASSVIKLLKYNSRCFFGDGYKGLVQFSPFDKILVTCGAQELPKDLFMQLKIGGYMVIPLGEKTQIMTRITKVSEFEAKREDFGDFSFVPMLGDKAM